MICVGLIYSVSFCFPREDIERNAFLFSLSFMSRYKEKNYITSLKKWLHLGLVMQCLARLFPSSTFFFESFFFSTRNCGILWLCSITLKWKKRCMFFQSLHLCTCTYRSPVGPFANTAGARLGGFLQGFLKTETLFLQNRSNYLRWDFKVIVWLTWRRLSLTISYKDAGTDSYFNLGLDFD